MKKNLSYRPEIDGLRCVAVLSVIFYHFDFTFLFMSSNILSLPDSNE